MKRSFSSIALAATIALTTAACSTQLDSDSPSSAESSTTSNDSSAVVGEANLLSAQGISDAELKEAIATSANDRTDWQVSVTRAQCLAGKGWEMTLDRADPSAIRAKTESAEEAQKHVRDVDACDEALGHNDLTPPDADEIRAQYKLDLKRQRCLKDEGLTLVDLPSEATYVDAILESQSIDKTPDFMTPRDQLGEMVDDPAERRRLSIKCINLE